MMKKIALFMALIALMLSFAACAEKAEELQNTSGTEATDAVSTQDTAELLPEETTQQTTEATAEATAEATTEVTGEHRYIQKTVVEATCTDAGIVLYTCKDCDESYTEEIPAYGHEYSNASCTDPAMCGNCGEIVEDALGHVDENGLCRNCGIDMADAE